MSLTVVVVVNLYVDFRDAGLLLPTFTEVYADADDAQCLRIEAAEDDMLQEALRQFTRGAKAEGARVGLDVLVIPYRFVEIDLAGHGDTLGGEDAGEIRRAVWQAGHDSVTARADLAGSWTV